MGGNPSVPTDKSCKLQVIGAGAPRTGTLSMSLALERLLDEPVMHGGSQLVGREDGETSALGNIPGLYTNLINASLRQTSVSYGPPEEQPVRVDEASPGNHGRIRGHHRRSWLLFYS